MDKMIAFCGLTCTECPAFLATKENSDEKRRQVAQLWSKEYKADIKPHDINCEGCLSKDGQLFSHCSVCAVRRCGLEKHHTNCGSCDEYDSCRKLADFFQMVPQGKI
ncbi:MAG: DUF3795 domain-containing protein, partial [Syntrophobacteraceae bacterium]